MNGQTAIEVAEYEHELRLILSCEDEGGEVRGGYEAPVSVVENPWLSPAVRRVLLHTLRHRSAGAELTRAALQQICPVGMGCATTGPNLWDLLTMPQADLDEIRTSRGDLAGFLDAAVRYLLHSTPLRAAFLGCTSLASLCRGVGFDVDAVDGERTRALWTLRLKGLTGREIGARSDVSVQRIYQLNDQARAAFLRNLKAFSSTPLMGALFARHLDAAGSAVLRAAADSAGFIRRDDITRFAWQALPARDAFIFTAVRDVRQEAPLEIASLLAWEQRCASPLQGGWTLLPLVAAHVTAVQEAHAATALGGWLSFASLITERSGVADPELAVALRFAEFVRVGEAVVPIRARTSKRRLAAAASVLHGASRPLHATELFDAMLHSDEGLLKATSYRTLVLDLQDEPDLFHQSGGSIVSLAAHEDTATPSNAAEQDPRPTVDIAVLDDAAASWNATTALPESGWTSEGFTGDFVSAVAATLKERRFFRTEEHVSLGELLRPEEDEALLRWARSAPAPLQETTSAGRAEIGMVLFAAHCAAAHLSDAGGRDTWRILPDIAGPGVRDFMLHGEAPRGRALDAMVRASHGLRLRRAWSFNCDNWITAMRLQCGFQRGDAARLREWVFEPANMPTAIRLMSQDPATGMARLLADIRMAVIGHQTAIQVHSCHADSPWWPGWSAKEFADALVPERRAYQPRPYVAAPRTARDDEPPEDLLGSDTSGPTDSGILSSFEAGHDTRILAAPGSATWQVCLGPNAKAFLLVLPPVLEPGAGTVAVIAEGAKAAGSVDDDGKVTWFLDGEALTLPLRGPRIRQIEVHKEGSPVAILGIELWPEDAFLRLVDLRMPRPSLLDPYRTRLSPSAPLAILCDNSLTLSCAPMEERPLDTMHRLMVFQSGLPDDFSIVSEGEVVWQPAPPDLGREMLEVPGAYLLGDGSSVAWGQVIDLQPVGVPDGFQPTRAVVGGQSLRPLDERTGGSERSLCGYRVLPGASPLLRQGRLDGLLDGRKVSIPLKVALRRTPRGGAIHDGERWQAIPDGFWLDRSRHAGQRLWLPRQDADEVPLVLFEGARPVAAVGPNGVHVGRGLLGLGEIISFRRGGFDQSDAPVPVAPCRDSGLVRRVTLEPGGAVLHLAAAIGSHVAPTAIAWWKEGPHTLPADCSPDGKSVTVTFSGGRPLGVAIFAEEEWLGTAFLTQPGNAVPHLLLAPDTASALGFAITAHLPLLLEQVRRGLGTLVGRNPALVGALLAQLNTSVGQHIASVLLGTWIPDPAFARSLVQVHLSTSEDPGRPPTDLERLGTVAPTALIRVLSHGWSLISRGARPAVLARLAVSAIPQVGAARLAAQGVGGALPEVEEALLAEAVNATRCDPNFLASRADASVLSVAWRFLTDEKVLEMPPTLQTALTLPSLRRWLNAALLRRLLNEAQ